MKINRKCKSIHAAVTARNESFVNVLESPASNLSRLANRKSLFNRIHKVQAFTLMEILDTYFPSRNLDFLSIDTEGSEFIILNNFNFDNLRGHAMDSMISGGCIISGATIERSLLSLKVRVGKYSLIQDSVILPHVEIGENVTLNRVIVDVHCKIPDNFKAGLNPDIDQQQFHVTPQGVTLITPELLGQTIHLIR
jgi:hypothetical protein